MVQVDRAFAFYALGRAAFGASPDSLAELEAHGFPAWVDDQLKAKSGFDAAADPYLRDARLHIKYPAGDGWAAADEMRPLASLDAPIATLWHLADHKNPLHAAERRRPRDEVIAATVLLARGFDWRAVYSASRAAPYTSRRPASAAAGRTSNRPPIDWRWTRSSATSRAKSNVPACAASIRSSASRDFPAPDGPRISTARAPTSTADACAVVELAAVASAIVASAMSAITSPASAQ